MTREIRRVRRPATVEEKARLDDQRRHADQDIDDLRSQARDAEAELRKTAMSEPTISGQLRRAVAQSGTDHQTLAREARLSPKTLAEFLVGKAVLDSAAIDKLATLLKHELRPVA